MLVHDSRRRRGIVLDNYGGVDMKFELHRTGTWGEDDVAVPEKWQYRVETQDVELKRSFRVREFRPDLSPTYTVKETYIVLHTLEELVEFADDCGDSLIVDNGSIEIYDGYRE